MEVSIILPALNEEKSIGKTLKNIKEVLSKNKISFEIIVVDSDSEDRTVDIARKFKAIVINEPVKGYGNALRKGFSEARGKYIVMYDPDGSYDANTLPLMIKKLKGGYDYVNGNRFANLSPNSMSFINKIGNKIINFVGNFFFNTQGRDVLSGYKGFRAESLKKLDLHAQKWDLNMEIHSKIKRKNLKFIEIPTNYFPRVGKSKLSKKTAVWNNFRFILSHSPNFVFIYPSIIFILVSLLTALKIVINYSGGGSIVLLFSMIVFIIGFQTFLFGITTKNYLHKKGFEKTNLLTNLGAKLTLERGIRAGFALFIMSIIIFLIISIRWLSFDRSLPLIYIKFGIIGFTLLMTSISIITYSFMNQVLGK